MSAVPRVRLLWRSLLVTVAVVTGPGLAQAEEPLWPPPPTRNLFGITGLIDMPSADMQPDAEIGVTVGYFGTALRNTVSFQFLPWLETSFRYSRIADFFPDDEALFDRSFDVKVRLVEESERWPAVALGLQDFLGTGVYSGEYIVATKGVDAGDWGNLRLTGGVGWGRFAGANGINNPLCTLTDSETFCERERTNDPQGNVNFGRFFGGEEIGLFGGVEWETPLDGLTATVEYSPDTYETEGVRGGDGFEPNWPVNFGLEYQPTRGVELGAYYMYGSEVGLRVTFTGNPFRPLSDVDLEPGPQPVMARTGPDEGVLRNAFGAMSSIVDHEPATSAIRDLRLRDIVVHQRLGTVRWAEAVVTERAGQICPHDLARAIDAEYGLVDVVTFSRPGDGVLCTVALRPAGEDAVRLTARSYADYPTNWYDDPGRRQEIAELLAEELDPEGIDLFGIEIAPTRVQVYIENRRFRETPRALGRTARALTRVMPPSVETFAITPVERSLPVSTIILQRSALEDQVERPDAARRTWATAEITDAEPIDWDELIVAEDLFPRFNWRIEPALPFSLFDPDAPFRADLSLVAAGSVEFLPGLSASAAVSKRLFGQLDDIERRSDSQLPRVRSDFARYLEEGDPALIRLTGDYLTKLTDDVYGRVSAGLLERMFGGISGEVLWKPATQDWGLGLEMNYVKQRSFETLFNFQDYEVATGHASFYWDTNYRGIGVQVDAGRYLAGDWGATFSVKRRFDNGWEVGAFATFTDVPFEEFGEGSFDKGIYLTIPFNWAVPYESRSAFSTIIRPLTRDGGQRLHVPNRLYDIVEDHDVGRYRGTWTGFWD